MADFWDGGVELEYDGASLAAYPGGYGLWRNDYSTPRYALLGSKVRYELRNNYSGNFESATVTTPRAWAVTDLVRMAGITGLTDATLAAGSTPFAAGNRLIDSHTYRAVLDDVAAFEVAAMGFDRLDQFFSAPISPTVGAIAHTFVDGQNCRGVSLAPVPGMERRVWRVRVRAGATRKSALAKIVVDTVRDTLSRDGWMVDFTATCQSIKDADPSAEAVEVQIVGHQFTDTASMQAWALKFFQVHGAVHFPATVEAPLTTETLALRPLLDWVGLKSERFGCTPTRDCLIWSVDLQLRAGLIRFGLLGFSGYPTLASQIAIALNDASQGSGGNGGGTDAAGRGAAAPQDETFVIACSDETTALTIGTAKRTFFAPYDFYLTEVQASLATAQTSGAIFTVDINSGGTSILSTKLTVDNTESTSITAAVPAVLSTFTVLKGAKITIDIDQVGDGTAKGLLVTLVGYQL